MSDIKTIKFTATDFHPADPVKMEVVLEIQEWERIQKEIDTLKARVAKLVDSLKEISNGPHAGEGFCYDVYEYRGCNCHKSVASEALKNCEASDDKPAFMRGADL